MNEIWKDITGYEGLYQVSNMGNVRSFTWRFKGKIMKQTLNHNNYLTVGLMYNGKKKRYFVHRLVAEAFIPNTNKYPYINHIDENKLNNKVENLEWCDNKYNDNYGTRNEKISKSLTGRKLTEEHIYNLRTSHIGYMMPEEQKKKISNSLKIYHSI